MPMASEAARLLPSRAVLTVSEETSSSMLAERSAALVALTAMPPSAMMLRVPR